MKFSTFLLAAAALHLALTVSIFVAGRQGWFPSTFDEHGIGISFAIDSSSYRKEATRLADSLWRGEFKRWRNSSSQFHVKLYSLSFATFGRVLGPNILSAEPLNLVYYLLILGLVFALGREVFDRRAGLLAAAAVAVWPSFLLHTTQMLRDPLFIVAMLSLVILLAMWLTREFTPARGLAAGAAG
ncbi:MAG TPA: glycosyltransferase family 39 protein, partial [Pyrinomonadaceae bacterium]|nr:glycosyltransferase family 39 protein [Pyrinomonadaceae bacterium]